MFKKFALVLAALGFATVMSTSPAYAKGFSGGHVSRPAGTTHVGGYSGSTGSRYGSTSYNSRSYGSNSYRSNSYSGRTYDQPRQKGFFSRAAEGIAPGIGHGLGFGIGSAMGHSIWHSMFGFGSDRYVENGQTGYQHGGYFGWIILIGIIVLIVWLVRRNRRRYY